MGAGNHGHEHNGNDGHHNGYDGHHNGYDGHHHRYDNSADCGEWWL